MVNLRKLTLSVAEKGEMTVDKWWIPMVLNLVAIVIGLIAISLSLIT